MLIMNLYNDIFPKTSDRRFVADQCCYWSYYIVYYSLIVIGIFALIGLVSYGCGFVAHKYGVEILNNNTGDFIVIGFLFFMGIGVIISVLILLVASIHDANYKPWIKDQKKIITIEYDEETQTNVPVNFGTTCNIIIYVLPFGSLRRYFLRLTLQIIAVLILGAIYVFISVALYRGITGDPEVRWDNNHTEKYKALFGMAFLLSLCAQVFLAFFIGGLYVVLHESCTVAWKRHKSEKEGAVDHKHT